MTELERINHLKAILIDEATQHDNINGGFIAIQAVQKMVGHASFKDYLHAICDGIWYGNWPWIKYNNQSESRTHRIGNSKTPIVTHMIENSSVDEHILETLRKKGGE